jgi:hypothetical protein
MKKTWLPARRCVMTAVGAIAVFSAAALGQENYTLWLHYKDITINTSATGYNIAGTVANFPYLVRLSAKSFAFSEALGNGQDIRFANATGTHLPYQIELWDSAGADAAVWVRVDQILGNNATQYIRMHWGRAGAADSSNGPAVFNNGFVGVWHLAEPGNDNAGNYRDATANANHCRGTGMVPTSQVKSVIGNGVYLDGSTEYLVSAGNTGITGNAVRTINFWARLPDTRRSGIVVLGTNVASGQYGAFVRNDAWLLWGYGAGNDWAPGGTPAVNTNLFVAVVHNGTMSRWYVNGAEVGTGFTHTYATTNSPVTLGMENDNAALSYFAGTIDEVEISSTNRSIDWLTLACRNQEFVIEDPPTIDYPVKEIAVAYNGILNSVTPVITGIVDSLTITPSTLPDYLVFNRTTGAISGWAQMYMSRTAYYVRAYNVRGFDEDTVYVSVYDPASVSKGALKSGTSPDPVFLGVSIARQPVISFSVPSPARVRSLQFRIYDCRGVCVWSRSAAGLGTGAQSMRVGKTPSGIYFFEMRCTGVDGRVSKAVKNSIVP